MADSLIDFGKMANDLQGFERTRIYEQNSLQQVEQNRLQERSLKLNDDHAKMSALINIHESPIVQANPALGDNVLLNILQLAAPEFTKAVDVKPLIPQSRMLIKNAVDGMQSGDQRKTQEGFLALATHLSPENFEKMYKAVESFAKLPEAMQTMKARANLNQARAEKISNNQARVNAGVGPYAEGVQDFDEVLRHLDNPDFVRSQKIYQLSQPDQRRQLPRPDGAPQVAEKANQRAQEYSTRADNADAMLRAEENGTPLPENVTTRGLIEVRDVGRSLSAHYDTLGQWALNPYDDSAIKSAKQAQASIIRTRKDLNDLDHATTNDRIDNARDALNRNLTNDELKRTHEKSVMAAQSETLKTFGRTPDEKDLADVATKHGVSPADILPGLANPANKGKLTIDLSRPTPPVTTKLQEDVIGLKPLLSTIDYIRAQVKKDPTSVGSVGAIQRFMGGIGQQVRDVALTEFHKDKNINPKTKARLEKMFDTAAADNVLASTIGLTYKYARVLSGPGQMSDKDLSQAEAMVGGLGKAGGSTQFLNHLNFLELDARQKASQSSEILKSGRIPSVEITPETVREMSIEDILQKLGEP